MKKLLFLLLLTTGVRIQAQELDSILNASHFNGTALIARKGNILLEKGYGNTTQTIYQLASITKQFTAAVILKLAKEKKLSLKDNMSKYFPLFPNGDSITIWHLLTHTSGLHNYTETDLNLDGGREVKMMGFLARTPLDFSPGSNWHYSNSGYVVLGYIIQHVTKMSYWQAVRQFIFNPLHMEHSGFDFTHLQNPEKAIADQQPVLDSITPFSAGGIYSTVEDLYKWHQWLQNTRWMDAAYIPCGQNNYGFGWQIDSIYGKRMVSHSGAITGFSTNIARITEEDVCIILLSNKGGETMNLIHLTKRLTAALYHQPYHLPVKRTPVQLPDSILQRYTGTFILEHPHVVVEISVEQGQLVVRPKNGPVSKMEAVNEKQFYIRDLDMTFLIDGQGNVTGFTLQQDENTRTAIKSQ